MKREGNEYTFDGNELRQLIGSVSKITATQTVHALGLVKKEIVRNQAYEVYSKRLVDGWINDGTVPTVNRKGRTYMNIADLQAAAETDKLFENHLTPVKSEQ